MGCFSSFSRIQEKFSKKLKTIVISKLFDVTWNNFEENHSLWMPTISYQAKVCHSSGLWFRNLMTSHLQMSWKVRYAIISKIFKISGKSNGRIIDKYLKFLSSHSIRRNRSLNFTPTFLRRDKDLEPMLKISLLWQLWIYDFDY